MTQLEIVKKHLKEYNYVSRNWALRNHITRLGALINRLNKEGYETEGGYFKKDYIYTIKKKSDTEQLNKQLKELLGRIPVEWKNQIYIEEVSKAIKSKHNYLKYSTLKKLSKNKPL